MSVQVLLFTHSLVEYIRESPAGSPWIGPVMECLRRHHPDPPTKNKKGLMLAGCQVKRAKAENVEDARGATANAVEQRKAMQSATADVQKVLL